jgi:hypothetical protein
MLKETLDGLVSIENVNIIGVGLYHLATLSYGGSNTDKCYCR